MKEISKEYLENHQYLKKIDVIRDSDMSKVILKLERLKENKKIKYYCVDFIVFDPVKHIGEIQISLWDD
jgi:hypothetical protein